MFSPAGYHPAAALWIEYLEHRLEAFYESTALHYRKPKFMAGVVRGSPLDICEQTFLKTLATLGFYLASPKGEVVRVYTLMRDEHEHLLTVLGPYSSAWRTTAMLAENDKSDSEAKDLPYWFQRWPHEFSDNNAWAEKYKPGREIYMSPGYSPYNLLKHHTLPFHFERHSYVISAKVPEFAVSSSLSADVKPILDHFTGWAICLDDATYQGEWMEYLHRRKELFPDDEEEASVSTQGRPRMKEAYAAFEAMGFDKRELSWEQVGRKIEQVCGDKPSPKTLRNWREEHLDRSDAGD